MTQLFAKLKKILGFYCYPRRPNIWEDKITKIIEDVSHLTSTSKMEIQKKWFLENYETGIRIFCLSEDKYCIAVDSRGLGRGINPVKKL